MHILQHICHIEIFAISKYRPIILADQSIGRPIVSTQAHFQQLSVHMPIMCKCGDLSNIIIHYLMPKKNNVRYLYGKYYLIMCIVKNSHAS